MTSAVSTSTSSSLGSSMDVANSAAATLRRPVQAQALHAPVRRQARADHVLVALVAAQQAVERGALRGGVAGRVARVARERLRRGPGLGLGLGLPWPRALVHSCARLGAGCRRVPRRAAREPAGPQARPCGRARSAHAW